MKFLITQEQFDEVLNMLNEAPFGKVMKLIQAVTSSPYVEQQVPIENVEDAPATVDGNAAETTADNKKK